MGEKSRMRQAISRWANPTNAEARGLIKEFGTGECVLIADAPDRERVTLRGTLKTVTLRPHGGVPALEAELYDGSDTLTLLWLGRRRIGGIHPGRSVEVTGLIGQHQDGTRVIYNPGYALRY